MTSVHGGEQVGLDDSCPWRDAGGAWFSSAPRGDYWGCDRDGEHRACRGCRCAGVMLRAPSTLWEQSSCTEGLVGHRGVFMSQNQSTEVSSCPQNSIPGVFMSQNQTTEVFMSQNQTRGVPMSPEHNPRCVHVRKPNPRCVLGPKPNPRCAGTASRAAGTWVTAHREPHTWAEGGEVVLLGQDRTEMSNAPQLSSPTALQGRALSPSQCKLCSHQYSRWVCKTFPGSPARAAFTWPSCPVAVLCSWSTVLLRCASLQVVLAFKSHRTLSEIFHALLLHYFSCHFKVLANFPEPAVHA